MCSFASRRAQMLPELLLRSLAADVLSTGFKVRSIGPSYIQPARLPARLLSALIQCVCCAAQVRNMSRQHFQALDGKNKDKSEGLKDAFGKSSKSFYR